MEQPRNPKLPSFAAGVLLGVVVAVPATLLIDQRLTTEQSVLVEWIPLTTPPQPVHFASLDQLVSADISLPAVREIGGNVKLIPEGNDEKGYRLGYKVHVVVDTLDLSKVPAEYLSPSKRQQLGRGTFIPDPLEKVAYEVHFLFTGKDKDGFSLGEITSEAHQLLSGEKNTFQEIAPGSISLEGAKRLHQVIITMRVGTCLTCKRR